MAGFADTGAVVIGRNEGQRLDQCLASLTGTVARIVYVDSGSTDGSPEAARGAGALCIELDTTRPFTAARARNAGLAALLGAAPELTLVQFVDGDCEVRAGWIDTGRTFLAAHPQVAVACGRRRERFPEGSVYNRLIDREWDTPTGRTRACGGDALMRIAALDAVGGFDPTLIAGEEPELCVRLRRAGWEIWRLEAEMTWHDAAITRFGQWWRRTLRAGHAYAEGAAMHGRSPERHNVAATCRALAWGLGLPVAILAGAVLWSPWVLLSLLAWPLQAVRIGRRTGDMTEAVFLMLGKLPEALGVLTYHWRRLHRQQSRIIEYKAAGSSGQ